MDETETIPYASLKRKMTLMIVKHLSMLSQKEKMKMNLMKKYIKNRSLKLLLRLKNKLLRTKKKIIKSEFEPNKVDIQISKESDIKKVQNIFDEVKEEKPIDVDNFFIDDNDIFYSEEIFNAVKEFIIDVINRTNVIAIAKRFIEESNSPKMEIVHPEEKKLRRKNKCQLMAPKRERM